MKKPHLVKNLVREGHPRETSVVGGCSSCQNAVFRADDDEKLQAKFDTHFKQVHMHEDASQTAARIVREATEDK
jgi:hypothetical protein